MASGLVRPAVGVEVDVTDGVQHAQLVARQSATIRVDDVDEIGVGNVQPVVRVIQREPGPSRIDPCRGITSLV